MARNRYAGPARGQHAMETNAMLFARRVFQIAGILGLMAIVPLYFMEDLVGRAHPPAITHPEYYYGFVGVVAAWQVAFLIIGRDPYRFRPLMIPAILEKATFSFAMIALYLAGRIPAVVLGPGLIDLTLGILFVIAYVKTAATPSPGSVSG